MDNEPEAPLDETAALGHGPDVPAALEARVVGALRAEGLIRTRGLSPLVMRIAASLLIFVGGAIAGRFAWPETSPQRPSDAPARYLLLLAGDVTPAADGSTRAAEYGEWARSVAARGIAVSGEELSTHAQVVSQKPSATFPDLSSAGGYFLISAADDAEAVSLARTCPHVKYGGSIVVRRVQ